MTAKIGSSEVVVLSQLCTKQHYGSVSREGYVVEIFVEGYCVL